MATHRRREPVILTVAEVAKLADAIEPRLRALVLLNAWCGLRFGESSELRRKDVGAGAVTLHVARGVTHRDGCHISTPKSGKERTVVVPPHIRGDVQAHLDTHVAKDREALLFAPIRGGCHLGSNSFRLRFNAALATIGRQGVRIHDLRHFAGTQVARVGTLRESMDRLGHSTVAASMAYQGRVNGRDVEIAEALSKLAQTDTAG
jgi:integrase